MNTSPPPSPPVVLVHSRAPTYIAQAERRVAQLRAFVGPQLLLDVLRVHVCTASQSRSSKRPSTSVSPPPSSLPPLAADGRVIARPVSPKKADRRGAGGAGGGVGGVGGSTTTTAVQPLERCIGACMRMLQAMLRSELTSPEASAATAGGGAGSSSLSASAATAALNAAPGTAVTAAAASARGEAYAGVAGSRGDPGLRGVASMYGQMPFLEGGGYGNVLELGVGDEGQGAISAMQEGGGGGVAAADYGGEVGVGGVRGGGVATGIDAAAVCLQECQSSDLQRGLLRVLLGLREERPRLLRRELLR